VNKIDFLCERRKAPKNALFGEKHPQKIWFGVIRWSYQYSVLEDSYYFGLKRIFEENKFFVRALEMAVSAGINCFFDSFVKCAFLPPFFNRWSDKKVHKTKNVKKGHISIPRTKGFDVKF